MEKDYYKILEIERSATPDDIKKAYRKLAMKYHPDRNQDDLTAEEKFKEVSEAYSVLSDPKKKSTYDRFGTVSGSAGGGAGFDQNSIFDMFDQFFAGSGRRGGGQRTANRGSDLRYNLAVSLEDIAAGANKSIRFNGETGCDTCGGSGAAPGTSPVTCRSCHGSGQQRIQQGFFQLATTCTTCGGTGQQIEKPCTKCHGTGRQSEERVLDVKVPAGAPEGVRLRLAGEGEPGTRGGPAGDLFVEIHSSQNSVFERFDADLFCRIPVGFVQLTLGDMTDVPLLGGGKYELRIPAGTQNGHRFRLRGKGLPRFQGNGHGDLIIEVQVEIPTQITEEQKEILRKYAQNAGDDVMPQRKGFWDRVQELF